VLKVKINQTAINLPLLAICGEFDTFIKCKRVQAMRLLSINKCLYTYTYICGPDAPFRIFYRRQDTAAGRYASLLPTRLCLAGPNKK